MVSISKSAQAYKVFVTRNAEGFKIRDCGDFTFKDGYRPKCPTCGHKMNKDGFAQKPKVIDYFGTADRQPAINDVTVIIESPGSKQPEIIPGKVVLAFYAF